MKKCSECVYAILADHGHSNYTVEGTDVTCSKNLNPHGTFDRWYGEDARDSYAEECVSFKHGDPVDLDVDTEMRIYGVDDPEVKWKEYTNGYVTGQQIKDAQ